MTMIPTHPRQVLIRLAAPLVPDHSPLLPELKKLGFTFFQVAQDDMFDHSYVEHEPVNRQVHIGDDSLPMKKALDLLAPFESITFSANAAQIILTIEDSCA